MIPYDGALEIDNYPPCPRCHTSEQVVHVIYMAAPMWFCECENVIFGWWAFVAEWFPTVTVDENGDETFALYVYEGSYLDGLSGWFFKDVEDEKDL
jgi:hypothetical protein